MQFHWQKNILAPSGITAAVSAIHAGVKKKKKHGSGTTTLIISNEKVNGIMKIVQALLLIFHKKESLKQLKIKQKNKYEDF